MDMDRYIGRLLDGRYEIMEVIGTGGMAVVYKARCHRLNRLVAIKILRDEYTQDEEFRRRFHAESQAVAMLSHPNIVSVYDVSTSDDADYIVMELIDGISLKQYMEKKGVLNWKETLHFAIQISKALEHAHSRGIIHRDIKPHNVMVLKNGSVKVADFGIARVMSKSNTLTKEALGSVHYISPEQAKGGRVDNRSDIYSLGVVMYEMMTGRPPYDGESPVAVAIQHINGGAQMPSVLNPNIPGGLEQIIMKAMEQEPGKRFNTTTAMLHDMDEFRKDPTILFDYNNVNTGLDDATFIKSPAAPVVEKQPVQKAPAKPAARQPVKKAPPKKRRRREEIIEEEERGGKVATVAVILCSIVALVAIGIFIATLLGDSGVSSNENMVSIPNLLNKPLDEAVNAKDYVVEAVQYVYSSIYAPGRIMEQSPAANTQVMKGSTVSVTVSLGPEPTVKKMEKLVGLTEDQAVNFLTTTQGIDINRILRYYESSSEVPKGCIIRTSPGEGEVLGDNDPIYLWVSTGPAVKTVTMVDLTSDFYNESSAVNWLVMNGFNNYTVQHVESTKPAGKVIAQNIEAGRTVDVTTHVVLLVSKSNEVPTEPPVVYPSDKDPETYVPKLVEIQLPQDILEDYVISIYRDGILVEERNIPAGTVTTQFTLTGEGIMTFEVRLSTGLTWTMDVDFTLQDVIDPTDPNFPTDPMDPIDPNLPAGPAEPEDPTEPMDPTDEGVM